MAPKAKKGGRGKTVNLTDFNENYVHEEAFDWVDDTREFEQSAEAKLSEKIAKQRQEYSRTANNTLGQYESFRAENVAPGSLKFTDADLQPPFVAHFGNLRNGTKDEDFLSNFNKDSIVTHRLINQDGKSFGFIEFSTARALSIALSLDGTFVRGRKIYADLATQKQIERLHGRGTAAGEGGRPGISRDGAGQQQPGGLATMDFSRDVFGGQQQPDMEASPNNGSSRFGSRNDLHTFGDLSRDVLGSVRQGSPLSGGQGAASPMNFSNWRNEESVAQPEFTGMTENRRSDDKLDRRQQQPRGERKPHSPAEPNGAGSGAAPSFGNWRDEPRAAPPAASSPPPRREGGGRGRGRGGQNNNNNNESSSSPKAAAPAGDKDWSNFRK